MICACGYKSHISIHFLSHIEECDKYRDDLIKLVKFEKGDCGFCKEKNVRTCEHGFCCQCKCREYCWLD
jgi:hypothetical protein